MPRVRPPPLVRQCKGSAGLVCCSLEGVACGLAFVFESTRLTPWGWRACASAVISFFPSCVLVHHHYIKPKPWSRFERFSTLVRAWFPEQEKVEEEPEEFTGLVAFFHHKWAPFIIR